MRERAKIYKGPRVHRAILEFNGSRGKKKEERRKEKKKEKRKRAMRVGLVSSFIRPLRRVRPHVGARRQHRNSGVAGINLCGATLSKRAPGPYPGVGGRYPGIGAPGETP